MLPEDADDDEEAPVSTGMPFSSLEMKFLIFKKNVRNLFSLHYLRFLMKGSMMSILRFDMMFEMLVSYQFDDDCKRFSPCLALFILQTNSSYYFFDLLELWCRSRLDLNIF